LFPSLSSEEETDGDEQLPVPPRLLPFSLDDAEPAYPPSVPPPSDELLLALPDSSLSDPDRRPLDVTAGSSGA
jgi:hypothetical protein